MLFLYVLFISCSNTENNIIGENGKTFSEREINDVIELQGSPIPLDNVNNLIDILVLPDQELLLAIDSEGEYVCKLYSLKNYKYIRSFFKRVNETDSTSSVRILGSNKIDWLYLLDLDKKNGYIYDLKVLNEYDSEIIPRNTVGFPYPDFGYKVIKLTNNDFFELNGITDHEINPFNLYDSVGNFVKSVGQFPTYDKYYKTFELAQIFDGGINSFSSNKDTIVKVYYYTDIVELVDTNGKLIAIRQGPDGLIPQFKRVVKKPYSYLAPTNKSKLAYYGMPEFGNNSIYALYSGNNWSDTSQAFKIIAFDKQLTPKKLFKLNIPLTIFKIDEKRNTIYGISARHKRSVVVTHIPH